MEICWPKWIWKSSIDYNMSNSKWTFWLTIWTVVEVLGRNFWLKLSGFNFFFRQTLVCVNSSQGRNARHFSQLFTSFGSISDRLLWSVAPLFRFFRHFWKLLSKQCKSLSDNTGLVPKILIVWNFWRFFSLFKDGETVERSLKWKFSWRDCNAIKNFVVVLVLNISMSICEHVRLICQWIEN